MTIIERKTIMRFTGEMDVEGKLQLCFVQARETSLRIRSERARGCLTSGSIFLAFIFYNLSMIYFFGIMVGVLCFLVWGLISDIN